jgi:opacity protein-like surface antigen
VKGSCSLLLSVDGEPVLAVVVVVVVVLAVVSAAFAAAVVEEEEEDGEGGDVVLALVDVVAEYDNALADDFAVDGDDDVVVEVLDLAR